MSFGFSVGDFVAVGELAFKLYNECYKIARGAPQEFRLLVNELTSLYGSIHILQQALKDPDSTLRQAGQERVHSVQSLETGIGDTLARLEKFAKKYEILGSTERKHYWTRFKWSIEHRDIDALRAKLVQHNTMLNLLLTAVGNSSLQRLEASNAAMDKELKAIKEYVRQGKDGPSPPRKDLIPSEITDDIFNDTLKAALMRAAEVEQPWSTIGIGQWMEAGRWWLQLAEMDLFTVIQPGQAAPLIACTNLAKATWILLEVIICHPQVPFLTATTQAEIRQFAAEIKGEYARLSRVGAKVPDLDQLGFEDLRIWETRDRRSLIRPRSDTQESNYLKIDGGQRVMFQKYANVKLRSRSVGLPCILSLLVEEDVHSAVILAQDQDGSTFFATPFRDRTFSNLVEGTTTVSIDQELFTFRDLLHAQIFECLVNATDFFLHDRKIGHGRPINLEAYMLIYAVESNYSEAVNQISEKLSALYDHFQETDATTVVGVALSLANSYMRDGIQEPLAEVQETIPLLRLFDWALRYRHSALVVLLLSEEAAWGLSRPWSSIELGDFKHDIIDEYMHGRTPHLGNWQDASAALNPESKGLLQIVNQWDDEEIGQMVLENSYRGYEKLPNKTLACLYAAEAGLTRVARLTLLDFGGDEEFHLHIFEDAVSRGCRYGHRDVVQTLVRVSFESDRVRLGLPVLAMALSCGPTLLVDFGLEESPATRGPFWHGSTLIHFAVLILGKYHRNIITVLRDSFEFKRGKATKMIPSSRRSTAKIVIECPGELANFDRLINSRVFHRKHPKRPEDNCDRFKDFLFSTPAVATGKTHDGQTSHTITITVFYYDLTNSHSRVHRGASDHILDRYRDLFESLLRQRVQDSLLEPQILPDGKFDVPSNKSIRALVFEVFGDKVKLTSFLLRNCETLLLSSDFSIDQNFPHTMTTLPE